MSVDEPVTLAAYDERWPRHFTDEAARLRSALGELAIEIAHIGSTAVRGLVAKPIVDVMLGVRDPLGLEIVARLEPLGYEDCGRVGGRRYLRKRHGGQQFNVQVVEYDGRLWRENLAFRDYLRSHPEAARGYAEAKRAALEHAPTLLAYSHAKSRTIEDLLRRAFAGPS